MKVGTYAVPFLLVGAFSLREEGNTKEFFKDFRFIGILMLIAYIVHQYEEHWMDLYGNYYSFYTFNNNFILGNLGQPESQVKPLSKAAIFVINTSLVWLVGFLAIWQSPKRLFTLFAMASIIVVNGVVHILASMITFQYNPGLVTSIVVFIPIYLGFIRYVITLSANFKKEILAGIIWAILAHIIMVGGTPNGQLVCYHTRVSLLYVVGDMVYHSFSLIQR